MKKRLSMLLVLAVVALLAMCSTAMAADLCPMCGNGELEREVDYVKYYTCGDIEADQKFYCIDCSKGGQYWTEGMPELAPYLFFSLEDYDNLSDTTFDVARIVYTDRELLANNMKFGCVGVCPRGQIDTDCLKQHTLGWHEVTCGECTRCGHNYHPSYYLSAEATCTTPQTCSKCGEVVVPAHHIPGPAATCTTPQRCTREDCGEILTPALNHEPGSAADCTSDQTCARCGEVLKYATGHNYKGMTNKEYTNLGENHDVDGICPNCGCEIGQREAHIYYLHVDGVKKCACGAIDPDYVAPIPDGLNPDDGWVYENGEKSDFTGLYPYNGGLFYILNGQWQSGANGLTLIIDEFWFLANGQVQEHHGFAEYDGEWFYLDGGKLDVTASGVYGYDGKTFLVAAGRLVAECTGLAQIPSGEWYYVAEGRVLTEFSGEVEYDGKTFQIVNGKLAA